jgi:hypothetical protein
MSEAEQKLTPEQLEQIQAENIGLAKIVQRVHALRDALEAIRAGSEPTVTEARLILSCTRSKHAIKSVQGYCYPDQRGIEPFMLGEAPDCRCMLSAGA